MIGEILEPTEELCRKAARCHLAGNLLLDDLDRELESVAIASSAMPMT